MSTILQNETEFEENPVQTHASHGGGGPARDSCKIPA